MRSCIILSTAPIKAPLAQPTDKMAAPVAVNPGNNEVVEYKALASLEAIICWKR